ncbi:MAG: RnfABCDGE type electron transport complex subunit D [Spirochaetales bacterium]|nr:RnfABCDGE type electron transport complex subunit D [Spirochaetales bacterium]
MDPENISMGKAEAGTGLMHPFRKYAGRNDLLLAVLTIPLYLAGVSKYGYRLIFALAISGAVGFGVEYLTYIIRKKKPGLFNYPVWILFPLVLPSAFPLWMLAVSVLFAVLIGVSFFGGHRREIASPIAIGWTFAALSFTTAFGFGWTYPFPGFLKGFTALKAALPTIDHPIVLFTSKAALPLTDLLTGNFPQTPGNAVPLVLLACGLILLILKAVDYRGFISFSGTILILAVVFRFLMPEKIAPVSSLLVGNFLFASFFVYPVLQTSSRTYAGRWITGILAGTAAFLIRNFSSYPDGIFFAVLFGNIFSPIIDEAVLSYKSHRQARYKTFYKSGDAAL